MTDTMHDLEREIRQEIRDEATEILAETYPEDRITEMVDGSVPIYTSTLMELAASDPWLATHEPEILAFDGTPTPANAVAGNVYGRLMEAAMNEWEKVKDEADDCAECGAPTLEDDGVWVNSEPPSNYPYPYPGSDGDFVCVECAGGDE